MISAGTRDWQVYGKRLIRRGRFYLCTGFLGEWDEVLRSMNKVKNGLPYIYPNTFIQFCGMLRSLLCLSYHQLKGCLGPL